jgi:peptidoglycan/LPS O-acetylase OafA/YrhL
LARAAAIRLFLMHQQKDGERWSELDGIRGIAACVVVIYHFYLLISNTVPSWMRWTLGYTPLYVLISGLEAMLTFFLISGFVLSLPYHRRPDRLDYPGFLIRRIARIYLPYLAGLSLAIAGNAFFHGLKVNDWFNQTWAGPIDPATVLQHVLFIGNYNYSAFNGAFWTLVFEMRVSLIFPFLCILVIRLGWVRSLVLVLGFLLLSMGLKPLGVPLQTTYTFRIASIFVAGILLSKFLFTHRESLAQLPRFVRHGIFLASLAVYTFAHLIPNPVEEGVVVIGACGIIFSALTEPAFSRILRLRVFQFLGRISYSIYLLHITILYLLVYFFYPRVPLPWLFLPFVVCVLAASVVFFHLVINPSIHIGRRLAKVVAPKPKLPDTLTVGANAVE